LAQEHGVPGDIGDQKVTLECLFHTATPSGE
jgi:hypothetical protein